MKKKSLEILHRHRAHLLEREQISLQDRISEENQQKVRLLQLQERVQATHNAKGRASSVEEIRALDEAAAYLHSRIKLATRAVSVSGQAREEALDRTLKMKQSRDQVNLMLERRRLITLREADHAERGRIDELVTSRYAMSMGAA